MIEESLIPTLVFIHPILPLLHHLEVTIFISFLVIFSLVLKNTIISKH